MMTQFLDFCCETCGYRFEARVLEAHEIQRAQREDQLLPEGPCPQCNGKEIRLSWD